VRLLAAQAAAIAIIAACQATTHHHLLIWLLWRRLQGIASQVGCHAHKQLLHI
jgi:hypothetical protein